MENCQNDFIVNSKGQCFYCLRRTSSHISSRAVIFGEPDYETKPGTSSSPTLYTVQRLAQYLKVDMTRVFSQKDSIPQSLLAKVKQSRLKVELCQECAALTNRFSERFQQWEKLEMEMKSELGQILKKMETVEESESDRFKKSEEDVGITEVLGALRTETMEKCTSKLSSQAPRIKIPKLTKKTIDAQLSIRKSKTTASDPITDVGFGRISQAKDDVKLKSRNDDFLMEHEDGGNEFWNDSHERNDDDSMEEEQPTQSKSSAIEASPKFSINHVTGKYKCSICSKEFSQIGFRYHYQGVHLSIRYKCNLCAKVFTQKPNYNTHLRSAHLGVRFQCIVCNQQFKQKVQLQKHQRKSLCLASKKANSELPKTT